jgi:CRP-like cAMP-binding protein
MLFHHCASKKLRRTVLVELAVQNHRHNRLLAAMPPNILALLEPDLKQVSLEQGAVLFEPGELIENIYFPLTGLISLMVTARMATS